jgi:hypothetical protein
MAAPAQVMLRNEPAQEVLRKPGPNRIRTVVVDDSPTFLQVACELMVFYAHVPISADGAHV